MSPLWTRADGSLFLLALGNRWTCAHRGVSRVARFAQFALVTRRVIAAVLQL